MEPALLITTPGFVHIFEEIINQMDSKSIFKSSLVCKSWWQVIQDHPNRWRCVIRRIRSKENLFHPDFKGILKSVETKKELKELGLVLKQFCVGKPRVEISNPVLDNFQNFFRHPINTKDSGYFKLVFGDLKRLEYFWQHLQNKNPTFISVNYSQGQLQKHLLGYSALHILAGVGHVETFQFVAERVDKVNPTNQYGETPLDIAKTKKHFGIVQMIEDKLQNPNKRQKV